MAYRDLYWVYTKQICRVCEEHRKCALLGILILTATLIILANQDRIFSLVPPYLKNQQNSTRYSYYACTQIYDEPEHYLVDWLDHQFNVVGFTNVCVINTGKPISRAIRERFRIAYFEKSTRWQEFQYYLTSCFIDQPMRPEDMLMIHDTDEYLNVRQPDLVFRHYHQYDMFHLTEVRYGQFPSLRSLPS